MDSRRITELVDRRVAAAVRRMERKLAAMIATGTVESVTSSSKFQSLKATAFEGDTDDDIQLFEMGGVRHVVLPGAECLMFAVGGKGANRAAIGVANRGTAPTNLSPGETCIYTGGPLGGERIMLKADGSLILTPGLLAKIKLGSEDVSGHVAIAEKVHASISALLQIGSTQPAPVGPAFTALKTAWDSGTALPPLPLSPVPPPVPINVGSDVIEGD